LSHELVLSDHEAQERIESDWVKKEQSDESQSGTPQGGENIRKLNEVDDELPQSLAEDQPETYAPILQEVLYGEIPEPIPPLVHGTEGTSTNGPIASQGGRTEGPTHDLFEFIAPERTGSILRRPIMVVLALALVTVGGIVLAGFLALRRSEANTSPRNEAKSEPAVVKVPEPVPPEGMVYVPGGSFKMGRNDGMLDERPTHEVKLQPYFLDRYEVTCEQYLKFVQSKGHRKPKTWTGGSYPEGTGNWPVTGITWADATAYAASVGKRLPTEAEWELAARGLEARLYPWGNQWRSSTDTSGPANAFDSSAGHPVDVGAFKSASPFGAYDMVGNAWEWTSSDWAAYPGGKLAKSPPYPNMKVMRGNFWEANEKQATTTFRIGWPADVTDPAVSYKNAGFRCAMDAPARTTAQ
jgi:formylglycine-generating enzyme required for sulfatase activity